MDTHTQFITARAVMKARKIVQDNDDFVDQLRHRSSQLDLEILADQEASEDFSDFEEKFEDEYIMNSHLFNKITRLLH